MKAEQVAKEMGVSTQCLSDVECGRKGMSGYNIVHLAKVLHVSTDYLLLDGTGTDDKWELTAKRIVSSSPATRETAVNVLALAMSMVQEPMRGNHTSASKRESCK